MQLIVGLRNSWKCVEVSLQDGCVPVIGGVALPECNIEPALWFKVSCLLGVTEGLGVAARCSVAQGCACSLSLAVGASAGLCVCGLFSTCDLVECGRHDSRAEDFPPSHR